MQSPPYNSYPEAGLLTAHFVLIGYFCYSLFLAYLKFGVFIDILLGVLGGFFCELLFSYFLFLVGSLLYLNFYQVISVV